MTTHAKLVFSPSMPFDEVIVAAMLESFYQQARAAGFKGTRGQLVTKARALIAKGL